MHRPPRGRSAYFYALFLFPLPDYLCYTGQPTLHTPHSPISHWISNGVKEPFL